MAGSLVGFARQFGLGQPHQSRTGAGSPDLSSAPGACTTRQAVDQGSAHPGRAGRPRLGIALALVAGAAATLLWGWSELASEVRARGLGLVEPGRVRLERADGWADPRWEEEIAWTLARFPSFQADDAAAAGELRAALARLSFVERVGEPQVLWPDGLSVPLLLRRPVACVRVGDAYQAVGADGVVLAGRWTQPPRVGPLWLPLIEEAAPGTAHLESGARLCDARQLDALAVARSMLQVLDTRDLALLGRMTIDARGAPRASVEDPGIVLFLEQGRQVRFGRSPLAGEPGELPVERKWTSLSRGLELLASGDPRYAWSELDVRWDLPAVDLPSFDSQARGTAQGTTHGTTHGATHGLNRRGG